MNTKQVLVNIGLKEKEAAVYLACLELGIASAQNIAKKANIKRTYFYDIAESLKKLGLLTITHKGKKRYFTAAPPEQLKNIQDEKVKQIDEAIPRLKAIHNISGQKPKITFYEGLSGIEEINKDSLTSLDRQDEIIGFTTEKFLTAKEMKLSKNYIKQRVAKGINVRVIGSISNELIKLKKKDKLELRHTKMLPKDKFLSNIEIGIYKNKIAMTNYGDEFGLIIESDDIAKPLKMIFEIIWQGGFVID